LFWQADLLLDSLAALSAGNKTAAKAAMIAMTISSSVSVNAFDAPHAPRLR
jgi:hypothetical protein